MKGDKEQDLKKSSEEFYPESVSGNAINNLIEVAEEVGGAYEPLPETIGAVGYTHFDSSKSEDNVLIVLLTKENMEQLPSQSLVRIKSLEDKRQYLGMVVAGPFAEPDGLRADSSIVVATTIRGKILLPRYHGRVHLQILGEEVDGKLIPPRYRPRPNSPVFPLNDTETARVLKVGGNVSIGKVVGQDSISVAIPADKKSVLPRHTGIFGTTGGGKSTTVASLGNQLQRADVATILIDVEGEYTEMDSPTDDPQMLVALKQAGANASGTKNLAIYHPVGRDTSRESAIGFISEFSIRFSDLSPYAVMEILDLSEAQQERFIKTYDTLKLVLKDLEIFPKKGEERKALEIDELETGYPGMTLMQLIDIAGIFLEKASKDDSENLIRSKELQGNKEAEIIKKRIDAAKAPPNVPSWKGLLGKLWRIHRLQMFDNPKAKSLNHRNLIKPGSVSVIDLSDTDSPQVNNLVIADVLRGVQIAQEERFDELRKAGRTPTPVVIIIEEAHEFLSAQRIRQMPVLYQQVARIAKRGRKRWLGLVFVTQLPQHLPDEVLGLLNNFILHKISDIAVVDRLRRSIGGIDKGLWNILPGLAPGQAIVSLASMTRPLLVSVDPCPCKLLLVE